jgi:iron complex transport system substrate-binding protein
MKKAFSYLAVLMASAFLITGTPGCQGGDDTADPKERAAAPAETRTLTDLHGRTVTVPKNIGRVLSTGPVETILIYMIAPDKLAGMSFRFNGHLVPDRYQRLPVVGGWFGTHTGNYETFIALEPDVILEGRVENIGERETKFHPIPVVVLQTWTGLTDYEASMRFLGELLGEEEQAGKLIRYYNEAIAYVNRIAAMVPGGERVRVYYAEGKDGLSTDPAGSSHTQLLEFCAGLNVADVALKPGRGMAEVSMEQIVLWDPDTIIIGRGSQDTLYHAILNDSKWRHLKAVRDGRIHVRPIDPFSWFDGPPGPNQIIGMYWTIHTLYPELTADLDLAARVKEFYADFYHYELSDAEVVKLLANPEQKP